MNLREYKSIFFNELLSIYEDKEIESFFYILLEAFHKMKRIDFALQQNFSINEEDKKCWENALSELKRHKPIQYILGKTYFFGLEFIVNENTLIPRPETEELVEWIIQKSEVTGQKSKVKILDIGTGSGCIAISIAKNLPDASVFAIDVSIDALETAKKNALNNNVAVTFLHRDILQTDDLGEQFDVIISNPPYVRYLEKQEIKRNVLDYEPHLALFVEDNDALLFYRKISELAQKNLSPNGQLFFEINQYLGKDTVQLLENLHFKNIELRKDLYGNDRMLLANV